MGGTGSEFFATSLSGATGVSVQLLGLWMELEEGPSPWRRQNLPGWHKLLIGQKPAPAIIRRSTMPIAGREGQSAFSPFSS